MSVDVFGIHVPDGAEPPRKLPVARDEKKILRLALSGTLRVRPASLRMTRGWERVAKKAGDQNRGAALVWLVARIKMSALQG